MPDQPPTPARQPKPTQLDRDGRVRRALAAAGHSVDHLKRMTDEEAAAIAALVTPDGHVLHELESGGSAAGGGVITHREYCQRRAAAKTHEEKPRLAVRFLRRFEAAFAPHAERMADENARRQEERRRLREAGLLADGRQAVPRTLSAARKRQAKDRTKKSDTKKSDESESDAGQSGGE